MNFQKVSELTKGQKIVRPERAREILRLLESGQLPNLVFSGEKPFQIEQFVNKRNDRVNLPKRSAENLHLQLATRTQVPAMVTMWAAVTADGRFPFVFIDRGVKIIAEYYRENVLKTVLIAWVDKDFGRRPWTFQQDLTRLHSARVNQEFKNLISFLASFLPHIENQYLRISMHCTFAIESFWKVGFSPKNTKVP